MRNIAFVGGVGERWFGLVFKSVTDPRDQGNKHHRDTSNTPKHIYHAWTKKHMDHQNTSFREAGDKR